MKIYWNIFTFLTKILPKICMYYALPTYVPMKDIHLKYSSSKVPFV